MHIQVSTNGITLHVIVYMIRGSECHGISLGEFNVATSLRRLESEEPPPPQAPPIDTPFDKTPMNASSQMHKHS